MSRPQTKRYRYGPSRTFVYVVGAAIAAQFWWALPESPASRDTAELERTLFGEIQSQRAISDIRCTRVSPAAANCLATLPDLGRTPVTARIDPNSGAITWELVAPAIRELR